MADYPYRHFIKQFDGRIAPTNEVYISPDRDIESSEGLHAMLEDWYLQGGFRVCADNTERNGIFYDRRKLGMLVYTIGVPGSIDENKYWKLINNPCESRTITDPDNYPPSTDTTLTVDADWEEVVFTDNWMYVNSGETTATNLEGVPPGTTFTGTTLYELWTQLFYPVVTPYFTINPDSYFVVVSGETVSFELEFFGNWDINDWTLESNSDWAVPSVTGGTGNTVFEVVCPENPSNFRKAVITVSVVGDSGTTYGYCYIEQFGAVALEWTYINTGGTTATNLEGYPVGTNFPPTGKTNYEMWTTLLYPYISTWYVDPSQQNVECPSGTTTFDIVFNGNWTGTTDWYIQVNGATWCTLTSSATGSGNSTFTVEYTGNCNAGSIQRTASIVVSLSGSVPADTRTVYVVQTAPTYPVPEMLFDIDGPYLYEVGATITSKTGTWATTNHGSIVLGTDSVQISGPQLTTIPSLSYDGTTGMTFSPSLVAIGRTSVGPWIAQANTVFGTVISDTSHSISWDFKIYWGRFSGDTITGSEILANLTGEFRELNSYTTYPTNSYNLSAGTSGWIYWCVYDDGLNKMSNAYDIRGWEFGMTGTFNPNYANYDVGTSYPNLGYAIVNITINGGIYPYRVYRTMNRNSQPTEINISVL